MTKIPHATWAEVYDIAFESSFGAFYQGFTNLTLEVITGKFPAGGKVIDFGAGTGRLSIPLSRLGFEVTAVEPCCEMLGQLEKKRPGGVQIRTLCTRMQDYQGEEKFDLALSLFSVLCYLLDEESLKAALSSAACSLKHGGILLIDIPGQYLFQSSSYSDGTIKRQVSITRKEGDLFLYQEQLAIQRDNGEVVRYQDEFPIRYWPPEIVLRHLLASGFIMEDEQLGQLFSGSGALYWLLRKT